MGDPIETERTFDGCRVVLCTLSMLSNPALDNCGVYRLLPLEVLVVDEASQIDVTEFMVRQLPFSLSILLIGLSICFTSIGG